MKNGFSIIELIIVLLVSALISGILLPNFSTLIHSAKHNNIKQHSYSLQIAIESYFLDTGTYPETQDIHSLLTQLHTQHYIKQLPQNPFTQSTFTQTDPSGRLDYTYTLPEQRYNLTAKSHQNKSTLITLSN
jgi:general secretion pathway protein G